MDVYDNDQIILCNHIKELLNEEYHKIKSELNQILYSLDNISNSFNNDNDNNIIKENINKIKSLIKSPYKLLDQAPDIQNSFLNYPSPNHPIFKKILQNLKDINQFINSISNNKIVEKITQLYNSYDQSHQQFINGLFEFARDSPTKPPSVDILKSPALLFTEDLNHYQVKSLQLSSDISSYNPVEYEYQERNKSSLSYGSVINNISFKVIRGKGLLKEFAIYQLYKLLYPSSKSTIISPTQLVVMRDYILSQPAKKELNRLKTLLKIPSGYKFLENDPILRKKCLETLQHYSGIFIRASLFTNGISLKMYLKQCEVNNDISYQQIDLESFSSHILSSLLVIPTDYKPEDFIIQNGTNKIIGIDNTETLEYFEIKKLSNGQAYPKIKNILFTLESLMSKPIHQNAKDQFIQHNPSLFILKWLLTIEEKHSNYNSLVSKLYKSETQDDEYSKEKMIKSITQYLNLRLQFTKGWITEMYKRFKLIQQLLIQKLNITHQELFKEIHPLTSNYYQLLSTIHPKPLDQISSIYNNEFSFKNLLDQSNFSNIKKQNIEKQIEESSKLCEENNSIKNSVKELIQHIEYNSISVCKKCLNTSQCISSGCENSNQTKSVIFNWLELVYSFGYNIRGNRILDISWYTKKYSIFKLLLSIGSPTIFLLETIKLLGITISDDSFLSIINHQDIINNSNIVKQIKFLISYFKLNIESVQDNNTLLDLAATNNNLNLFIKLLDMGAGRNVNSSVVSRFYQNLSNEKKLILKPYLLKLFIINPKINWEISLNHIFPLLLNSSSNNNNNLKILSEVTNSTKRIISNEIWNELFDESTGELKNSRSVTLIKDEYCNGIYIKFKPQFPGIEIAVHNLCERLFNDSLTPHCELASINNIPVLLTQEVPGEPLIDILERGDENILDKIEASNISKQLIMAMLTNNGDGNLSNFILVQNMNRDQYLLYSIDNDLCFMPSISVNNNKNKFQVETVLFLFNQMKDKLHKDVIHSLENLDFYTLLKSWLTYLKHYNQLSTNHFEQNKEELKRNGETIIGISFIDNMIGHLFSKMQHLKALINQYRGKNPISYNHFNVLEIIEPLVYNRYQHLYNSPEISKLSILNNSELSRDVSNLNTKDIQDQFWGECYGPSQAIEQLNTLYKQSKIKKPIYYPKTYRNYIESHSIQSIKSFKNNYDKIKVDFQHKDNNKNNSKKEIVFDYLKSKEISNINLENCYDLSVDSIKQFKLDYIVKLNLSGSKIIYFGEPFSKNLYFKSLIKIKLDNCIQLHSIKIESPNLVVISAQNCKQLEILDIDSLNMFSCSLRNSVSTQNVQIINKDLSNNNELEYLDISESDLGEEFTFTHNSLKWLYIESIKTLKKINLELPVIESFSFVGCPLLKEISTIRNHHEINNNLWNILESHILKEISINMVAAKQINNLNNAKDFIIFVPSDSSFLIPPNSICKFYYKVPYWFTFKSYLPSFILSLSISGDLPIHLYIEKLPKSIKFLQLYNTKMFNTIDLKLEHLLLGYRFKTTINLGFDLDPLSNLHPLSCLPQDKVFDQFDYKIESGISANLVYFFKPPQPELSLLSNTQPSENLENSKYLFKVIEDLISTPKHLLFYNFNNGYIFDDNTSKNSRLVLLDNKSEAIFKSNTSKTVYLDMELLNNIFSISSLQPPAKILECINGYNQPIISGTIPSTITSLFLREVNYPLSIGSIPPTVKHLELCDGFNQVIKDGFIPETVEYLVIGNIIHSIKRNLIPKKLEKLGLGINFKLNIFSTGLISNTLQELIIFGKDNYDYFIKEIKPKLLVSPKIKMGIPNK